MTLREVASITGMTIEGVRVVEARALRKLRRAFGLPEEMRKPANGNHKGKKPVKVMDHNGIVYSSIGEATRANRIANAKATAMVRSGEWKKV